jgi:hypothetical protein
MYGSRWSWVPIFLRSPPAPGIDARSPSPHQDRDSRERHSSSQDDLHAVHNDVMGP